MCCAAHRKAADLWQREETHRQPEIAHIQMERSATYKHRPAHSCRIQHGFEWLGQALPPVMNDLMPWTLDLVAESNWKAIVYLSMAIAAYAASRHLA